MPTERTRIAPKYRNAVLYFLNYCNNRYLGITKLNKLMYYLDFISYRDRGKPVTGDKYVHLDYGPVPRNLDTVVLPDLKTRAVEIREEEYEPGKMKVDFIAREKPNMAVFDTYERKLLNALRRYFLNMNTEQIVALTHSEAPWFNSSYLDDVSFNFAGDLDLFDEDKEQEEEQILEVVRKVVDSKPFQSAITSAAVS